MDSEFTGHMENVSVDSLGSKLCITIDTTKRSGLSKTGKSVLVATSRGGQKLPSGLRLNITLSMDLPEHLKNEMKSYL